MVAHHLAGAQNNSDTLEVLHWWNSTSEHQAIDTIAARAADEHIAWHDALVPAGSGVGAVIVLKSRVLAGQAPDVAQLNGPILTEWTQLGLLRELDTVAANGHWEKLLLPPVYDWIVRERHVMAVPLGVHRVNTLFYRTDVFAKLGLKAPQTWDEFEQVCKKLSEAGLLPIAQSSEPWQVATLFESLVLGLHGAEFYESLLVRQQPSAFADQRFITSLERLRRLKQWMNLAAQPPLWSDVARQFGQGQGAMLIMGDWAKGELHALGLTLDRQFTCTSAPGNAHIHLFDIDTLAMFATSSEHEGAQLRLAQLLTQPSVQADYNRIKGSIPVLRATDPAKLDACARVSWQTFVEAGTRRVPSLTHRMAADETSRDAIISEIHRYFSDDRVTAIETQRRLISTARTLGKMKRSS